MRLNQRAFFVTALAVALIVITGAAAAQRFQQPGIDCPAFVQQALDAVDTACNPLDRNSACYGNRRLIASFSTTQAADFFSQTADRVPLTLLTSIRTLPLNRMLEEWGISVLSLQANMPGTLPGQNTVFMLMGDASIESAVSPDQLLPESTAALMVSAVEPLELHFFPSDQSEIIGTLTNTADLLADAVSTDRVWVRVADPDAPLVGWVHYDQLSGSPDLGMLPQIDPTTQFTPMQAFYLRTSVGRIECTEAPNTLLVQGPEALQVQIQANGADIRIGSTILLEVVPIDPALLDLLGGGEEAASLLQVIVIDGEAVVNPDTPNEQVIPAGHTSFTCLTPLEGEHYTIIPECGWTLPEPLTDDELAQYAALDDYTLNYPITLPEGVIATETATATATDTRVPLPGISVLATNTSIPSATATATLVPVFDTNTPAPPTDTFTPSDTPTITETYTATATPTSTSTGTNTSTATSTSTGTSTSTATETPTETATPTEVFTSTPTDLPLVCAIPDPVLDGTALIQAIIHANDEALCPGKQTINLIGTGSYVFSSAVSTLYGPSVLPVISTNIEIQGYNATLMLSGANIGRIFSVSTSGMLHVSGVTVSGAGESTSDGGVLYNEGTTQLSGVNFYANTLSSARGGAIKNAGSLILEFSRFDGNGALEGGALYNIGSAYINRSTFSGNYAQDQAGAIYNSGSGVITITNSTISGNVVVDGVSGGVHNTNGAAGSVTLSFVTMVDNQGAHLGGTYFTHRSTLFFGNFMPQCAASNIINDGSSYTDSSSDVTCGASTNTFTFNPFTGFPGWYPLTATSMVLGTSDCLAVGGAVVMIDQPGNTRPTSGCDPGAVELP